VTTADYRPIGDVLERLCDTSKLYTASISDFTSKCPFSTSLRRESIRGVESIRAFIAQDSMVHAELVTPRIVAASSVFSSSQNPGEWSQSDDIRPSERSS
jgi:hypothetical protein